MAEVLNGPPYSIPTFALSIDQFYLTHDAQQRLASDHPSNPLIQHRGQPSTHDLPLATEVLSSLRKGRQTCVPRFDKSAFDGEGDRAPEKEWEPVNEGRLTKLIIFEGWCIGFRAIPDPELQERWENAVFRRAHDGYESRLALCQLSSIQYVNNALQDYHQLFDQIDLIIHLDAEDPLFVYEWRLEQEHHLRTSHGSSMTDDEVTRFVDGYYPAYELYTDGLRTGPNCTASGQLRLILNKERNLVKHNILDEDSPELKL